LLLLLAVLLLLLLLLITINTQGDMKFAVKPEMKETKMNMWHPAVYRTKFKPEFNSDNTFSPYSNQYRTGKVDEHTRDSEEFDALGTLHDC
jgi:hypothetical protein